MMRQEPETGLARKLNTSAPQLQLMVAGQVVEGDVAVVDAAAAAVGAEGADAFGAEGAEAHAAAHHVSGLPLRLALPVPALTRLGSIFSSHLVTDLELYLRTWRSARRKRRPAWWRR